MTSCVVRRLSGKSDGQAARLGSKVSDSGGESTREGPETVSDAAYAGSATDGNPASAIASSLSS